MKRKKFLIVDGYNVINDWEELSLIGRENLETARTMLVEKLAEYASFTGTSVEVVFDAYRNKDKKERRQTIDGVEVFYTKMHQTADSHIEKRTSELTASRKNMVFVATSDGAEQQIVLGKGASRISSRELLFEIKRTKAKLDSRIERVENGKAFIGDALDSETVQALQKWREKKD